MGGKVLVFPVITQILFGMSILAVRGKKQMCWERGVTESGKRFAANVGNSLTIFENHS